ncbi:hypothetical protein M9458_044880, partial [Cirrhinus mrigala]
SILIHIQSVSQSIIAVFTVNICTDIPEISIAFSHEIVNSPSNPIFFDYRHTIV